MKTDYLVLGQFPGDLDYFLQLWIPWTFYLWVRSGSW